MFSLAEAEKQALLRLARGTLTGYFQRNAPDPIASFEETTPTLKSPHPCFVSLYSRGGRLRGCIGCTATTDPLYHNVSRYTELAAFQDPRFPSLKHQELADLTIQISVLGPLRPISSVEEIAIGTHGLCVEHELSRGLLLAQVAVKHGFDREAFRDQTCLKAGLEPEHHASYEWRCFEEIAFEEAPIL